MAQVKWQRYAYMAGARADVPDDASHAMEVSFNDDTIDRTALKISDARLSNWQCEFYMRDMTLKHH